MNNLHSNMTFIDNRDKILVTGSNGFVGSKVVEVLLSHGYENLRCFVRPSSDIKALKNIVGASGSSKAEIIKGNLLNAEDCIEATKGSSVIFHLAAGMGKTFSDAYLNTVVTTKRLLEASAKNKNLKRFVNVSSFSCYSNIKIKRGGLLDETCDLENRLVERFDPYCYAKTKQEQLVVEYCNSHSIPYSILRPGVIFGPNVRELITVRVGIGTFGIFLHLGGSNQLPLTYIDNCAHAIVLSGIKQQGDRQIFNIVDDDLPTSREFLKLYKKNVGYFSSVYVPYIIFYTFSFLWEKYSKWSEGQFPPVFNRRKTSAFWKGNVYSNQTLKNLLNWKPLVPMHEALNRYFWYLREKKSGNPNA